MNTITTHCFGCHAETPHTPIEEFHTPTNRTMTRMTCDICGTRKAQMGHTAHLIETEARRHAALAGHTVTRDRGFSGHRDVEASRCPRCNGNLLSTGYDEEVSCLQCSYSPPPEDIDTKIAVRRVGRKIDGVWQDDE